MPISMGFDRQMVWMITIALCVSDTSLPLLLALPLVYTTAGNSVDSRAKEGGNLSGGNAGQAVRDNISLTEAVKGSYEHSVNMNNTSHNRQSLAGRMAHDKAQHITLFKSWRIDPSSRQKELAGRGDSKIMVLPLGFLLAFLIGVAIKATHWWNEDIRYADGLMINVYNPHKTHRKVLMKVYSTERAGAKSLQPRQDTPSRETVKALSRNSVQSDGLDDLSDEDEVFTNNNTRRVIRPEAVSLGGCSKTQPSPYGNRSPTESVCSRCRQLETVGSQLLAIDKDANARYYDEHILELCKLATVSSSLAMRRLQRQCSVLSTQSSVTVTGETCRENAPLFASSGDRSSGKLNQRVASPERSKRAGRKTLVEASKKATPRRCRTQPKRVSSMTERTASESRIGSFAERDSSLTDEYDVADLAGIDALLKNSIQLNLDILQSLNASRLNKSRPIQSCASSSSEGQRCNNYLASDPASPNRTSRGSSSYLSSSDIASSNTTSTRTSVTALVSSHSSAASLSTHSSRRQSKRCNPYVYGKHSAEGKTNPKAFSVPSLKLSNKAAASSTAHRSEKDKVVFTIGSQNISASERRSGIRRTMSNSGDSEWTSSGHHQVAVCRSVSLNSSLDCKQIAVGAGDDLQPSVESTKSRDALIV